jgi:UDP-N-acetylmuramoyl-tripeptide--D-alanyl-D-alanine ligase
MNIKNIIDNVEGLVINPIDGFVSGFSNDTRTIEKDNLYFGIKGENFDGNLFYRDAFEKGALCCILDNIEITDELNDYLKENHKCIIKVKDTIIALGNLAKYKRSTLKIPVVAITGSAGKTSTKDMIFSVLNQQFRAAKTMGNHNNQIGLPLTILGLKDEECLVLEMGMNHFGEISYLTKIAKPDVAVITNIGTAHIGNLGSRENILKAKMEILEGLATNGTIVINNDNDMLHQWYLDNKNKYKVLTFGFKSGNDFYPEEIKMQENESSFTFAHHLFEVNYGGEHFVYNALCALTVGSIFKIDLDKIENGIKTFALSGNRMKISQDNNITIIDDSYNANYDAVKYAIKYLGKQVGRKIAVLGTMRELGDYSVELHSKLGNDIVDNKIDILITVGEYSNYINEVALQNGFEKKCSYHFDNNNDAIELLNQIKKPNDVILVKASFLCNFKEIVEKIK